MADRPHLLFVQAANPHAWLLTADRLHEQAVALRADAPNSIITEVDAAGQQTGQWEVANKACFVLAGFALENAIKAFLVYENPGWISNGKLSRRLRSHRLVELQKMAATIPYKTRLVWVLEGFEAGLESWARYPCALSLEEYSAESRLTDRLWTGYLRLMRAYGRALQRLLNREWRGPHGWRGRYTFTGKFLSCVE